jgi:hypothetical protein
MNSRLVWFLAGVAAYWAVQNVVRPRLGGGRARG